MSISIFKESALFRNIPHDIIKVLANSKYITLQNFEKNEYVWRMADPIPGIGLLVEGDLLIAQEDYWGNRSILAHLQPGELFGEAFYFSGIKTLPVNVIANQHTTIAMVDWEPFVQSNKRAQPLLLENMLHILAQKNRILTQKIDLLSKRSTMEKLSAYLSSQARLHGSNTFHIPFNRQALADYLCVERSAMAAVLSKMKKMGLIDYHKNSFILIDHQ